jgi:hypothetical protein
LQAQLTGASEQLSMFHAAMQHKARARIAAASAQTHINADSAHHKSHTQEATLAQLMDEQGRMQASMADMQRRWAEEKAAHGAASASDALAELAAARQEEDRLRGALQRCFADYGAAVEALYAAEQRGQALQADAAAHDAAHHGGGGGSWWRGGGGGAAAHAQHGWGGDVAPPQQHDGHFGDHRHEPMHHHQAGAAAAHWGGAHADAHAQQQQRGGHVYSDTPLWSDDAEALRYAQAMADRA